MAVTTYDPATVDMSDFPASGFPYDDPYVYPAHSNRIVSGKELAQIQAAMLRGYRTASIINRGSSGLGVGALSGTPSIPLPENYVAKTLLADVNDLSILTPKTTVLRIVPSGAGRLCTGLGGGVHGRRVTFLNAGALFLTLKAESSSSQALNRFAMVTDLSLWTGDSAMLEYDGISGRWRVISKSVHAPSFRAYRNTSSQVVTQGATGEAMECQTENWDTHGWYDTSNFRFTPLIPGKYRFSVECEMIGIAVGAYCFCGIKKNGTGSVYRFQTYRSGNTSDFGVTGTTTIDLNGTDYVQGWVAVVTGAADGTMYNGSGEYSYFEGERIGD